MAALPFIVAYARRRRQSAGRPGQQALLLPIGCFAAFLPREISAPLKVAVVVVSAVRATANLVDNVRVIRGAYVRRAFYRNAYILSRERVILGSFGPARIPEYERRVNEHPDTAVDIVRVPCQGQLRVAAWCIQLPINRPGGGAR